VRSAVRIPVSVAAAAAGLAVVLSSRSPGAGAVFYAAALLLDLAPRLFAGYRSVNLSPMPAAVVAALCGIPAGVAAGALAALSASLPDPGAASREGLRRVAASAASFAAPSLMLFPALRPAAPEAACVVFLVLLMAGRTALDFAIPGGGYRRASLRWAAAAVLMCPAAVLSLHAALGDGIAGAVLLLVPAASFTVIGVMRERRLGSYSLTTRELALQNRLASELASSRSTTDFLGLVRSYLSPRLPAHVALLTRQGAGSGWVGWTSSEQRTLEDLPGGLEPPKWDEVRWKVSAFGSEGMLVGLTHSSDMLLFADGAAAEALTRMRPDVRGNLVSLIAHAWLAVGHSLTIDSAFIAAAMLLARLADSKDDYTHGHSIRVARLSNTLGSHLGLSAGRLRTLRVGALLHDLGKVAVPAEILTKRGLLTRDERSVIERHPVEGSGILGSLRGYDEVRDIVRCHHERLDGKGYPVGLSGRRIPFLARIVAVADTFDAITSSRSYRADSDPATALEAIRAGSGTQFDARVVGALEEMISSGHEIA